MRTIIYFLLFLIANNAFAQISVNLARKHPDIAYVYQQYKYTPEDAGGDILLAYSLKKVPMGLWSILQGKRGEYYSGPYLNAYRLADIYPQISRINSMDAEYVESLPVPENFYRLDSKRMQQAFINVIVCYQ